MATTWAAGLPTLTDNTANAGKEFIPTFWIPNIYFKFWEQRVLNMAAGRIDVPAGRGDNYNLKIGVGLAARGTTLTTGTKVPMGSLTYKTVVGTINPWGQGVSLQTRLMKLAPHDLRTQLAQNSLAKDIADVFEYETRDELMTATTNLLIGGTHANIGSKYTGTNANFIAHNLLAMRTQFQRQNVPPVIGNSYIAYLHPYQIVDLYKDTTTGGFTDVSKYNERGMTKFDQFEAGEVFGFRIIPCNKLTGTLNKTSAGTNQYVEALCVGANAFANVWGEGGEPTFAYEPNYETDFGRVQALAWLADGDVRLIVDEYAGRIMTTVSQFDFGTTGVL